MKAFKKLMAAALVCVMALTVLTGCAVSDNIAEKKLVEEDAVVAPVYHRGSAVLTKSNVKNLISHPIGVPLEFKYASFE